MTENPGLELRVGDPVFGDPIRGRCRLHPETMERLGLSPGEPVTLTAEAGTAAATVYPADHGEWGLRSPSRDTVYVGLPVLLGETPADVNDSEVLVRPVTPAAAERVVYEAFPSGTAAELTELFSTEVVGTLALAETPLMVYEDQGSATQGLNPLVIETVPDGVVVVTDDANLEPHRPDESEVHSSHNWSTRFRRVDGKEPPSN